MLDVPCHRLLAAPWAVLTLAAAWGAPAQMADERRFLGVLERVNALAWREGDRLTLSTPDGHAIEARRP